MIEHFSIRVVTPPIQEPITLGEAKDELRVSGDGDNVRIEGMIQAARELAESFTRRAIVQQTLRLTLDRFPNDVLLLPRPELRSISSITYVDSNGVEQTLSSANYILDSQAEPARLTPLYGQAWPTTRWQLGAVQVTYVAGYEPGGSGSPEDLGLNVPQAIKRAMLLAIYEWYWNCPMGKAWELPMASQALLHPFRCYGY